MNLSAEDLNQIGGVVRTTLEEFAVPKPSRIAEYYAGLTLSIVLLREQCIDENTPKNRKVAVGREIATLMQKRAELEEAFDVETSEHIGGS